MSSWSSWSQQRSIQFSRLSALKRPVSRWSGGQALPTPTRFPATLPAMLQLIDPSLVPSGSFKMIQNASKCKPQISDSHWLPLATIGSFPIAVCSCTQAASGRGTTSTPRGLLFVGVSESQWDALCRLAHIGASLNNPKVAATMAKGQSAVGSSEEDLHGRRAWTPGCTWAPAHQAGENAGVLMDCTGRDQQLVNGIHADVFRALWMGEVGEQFMMIYAFWNIWTNGFSAGMEHWVNILLPEPLLHWVAIAIRSIAAIAFQGTSMVTDDPCWYTLVHIGTPYACWLGVLSLPMSKPQSLSFRSAGQPSRFISL